MRTTAKPVVEAIRAHILEDFEGLAQEENGNKESPWQEDVTATEMLISQIDYMRYGERSVYQTALDWVEGGSLLIYHTDVKAFLNNLGINPTGKEYTDDKSWRLYCHLVAREITKIVEAK